MQKGHTYNQCIFQVFHKDIVVRNLSLRKKNGALGRIRTSDHLIRSQVLYPTELRARKRSEDKGLSKKPTIMQAKDFAIVKSAILDTLSP